MDESCEVCQYWAKVDAWGTTSHPKPGDGSCLVCNADVWTHSSLHPHRRLGGGHPFEVRDMVTIRSELEAVVRGLRK